MTKAERLTNTQLEIVIGVYRALALTPKQMSIHQREVLAFLLELQANRRGEFICSKCYLRKDGEVTDVDF
jgi:hypothetical protein